MFKSIIVYLVVIMTIVCTVHSNDAFGEGGCSRRYGIHGTCWRYCVGSSGAWCYTGVNCIEKECRDNLKCVGIKCPANYHHCVLKCPSVSDCSIVQSVITCEGSSIDLKCSDPSQTIKIISANYGRTQPGEVICPHDQILTTECISDVSKMIVAESCDGKSACTLAATNEVFTDPCVNTYKYLEVKYDCV